jgi:hypothetical protein
LRALLILGPAGFLWTYWVWTFVDEGDAVRVTIITLPHGRITGKATALISRSAVDRLAERLASAGVEQARSLETIERAAARHSHDGSAEWGFQLLFVQWMETRRLLHARIDPGGDDEAIDVASEAFDSFDLQRTYVHGDRDLSPPEKPRHSGELRLALALARAGRSELDTALARRGYSSAPTIELGLALGMDVVLDRWRFGYDVGFSLPRDAYRRSDQSAVTVRRHGITAHAGYDVVETQNLSVFPFVGLGWNGFELEVDAATSPIPVTTTDERVVLERDAFTLEGGFGFTYVMSFAPRRARSMGLLVGTRLGYLQTFAETSWTTDSDDSVGAAGPEIGLRGPVALFALGIGNAPF